MTINLQTALLTEIRDAILDIRDHMTTSNPDSPVTPPHEPEGDAYHRGREYGIESAWAVVREIVPGANDGPSLQREIDTIKSTVSYPRGVVPGNGMGTFWEILNWDERWTEESVTRGIVHYRGLLVKNSDSGEEKRILDDQIQTNVWIPVGWRKSQLQEIRNG